MNLPFFDRYNLIFSFENKVENFYISPYFDYILGFNKEDKVIEKYNLKKNKN